MTEPAGSATMAQATFDGATVTVYRSEIDGSLVVGVDTTERSGKIRVNVNEGTIFNADPEHHDHRWCSCVEEWECRR